MLRWFTIWLMVALGGSALAQDYQIKPGDRLDISVLEDPGLNRQVLVRPDGKISMPLAGSIDAANRTPEQVQVAIRRALARDFVQPPAVTVSLLSVADEALGPEGGATIYLIGQVRAPGRYDLPLPINALQALAVAGGPDVFAARHRIQIRRRENGQDQVILFDYDLIEQGAAPIEAVELRDGDVIVAPERGLFE